MKYNLPSIAAGALLIATPTFAQEPAPAPAETPAPTVQVPDSASLTEDKLRSFAVAFLAVDKVNQDYIPRVEAAQDDAQRTQLREEATEKMVEAVEQTDGITPQEYGSIIAAAQNDPALIARINEVIQQNAAQ